MDESPLDLRLDVWSACGRSLPEVRNGLRDRAFRGIVIVAPEVFALEDRSLFPLIGFYLYSTAESGSIDFDRSAIIATVRLESNETFAGSLFFQHDGAGGGRLALAAERPVVRPRGKCILSGEYQLPRSLEEEAAPPSLALVITGDDVPGPFLLHLELPRARPGPGTKGRAIGGSFAIDLFARTEMPRLPQTYHVWAFSGEQVGGPASFRIET